MTYKWACLKKIMLSATYVCSLLSVDVWSDEPPWQHGALGASESGHSIAHTDGEPFLWMGDTAWGMFQQLTREEIDRYLDNRQALGFTVIQSVAFWFPHGGGLSMGPHNAANVYGHRPFVGEHDAPNTAQPLLIEGGDANKPNDYWDHADYIVAAVKKRNMYLALLPCWGRAYVTPQMGGQEPEFNRSEAKSYGEFLGKRYKNEPHILWVLGGDAKAQLQGYDKNGDLQNWDKRDVFRAMAEGIAKGVTGKRLSWKKKSRAWDKLFITFHPDGDAPDNSSKWFHNDAWLSANGVEVWKEVDRVYAVMLKDYQLTPAKPSLFLEGSYEYGSYRQECGWITPLKYRRQVYHSFFAGAAGHTYGAGPIWPMRGNEGDYSCGYTWEQALAFPGAVQFAAVAKPFLIKHDWSNWVPDGGLIEGRSGSGESKIMSVKLRSAQKGLIYFSNRSHVKIKNILGATAGAVWFDPRNGREEAAETFLPDEVREMAPPSGWEDGVLILNVQP
ncbi:Putative collagen-binding domain of a collagenase [Alteromonadaceae bacterium Bs31]|nr:Putative collagen-binding domain of a collagenase [Alteromonadaceae bacterium Bs31]